MIVRKVVVAGAIARVPLGCGVTVATIDARFADAVGAFNWSLLGTGKSCHYAARSDRTRNQRRLLHNFVWFLQHGRFPTARLDHQNRDGLDCRLQNLREATIQDNNRNQGLRRDNKSGFKGVSCDRKRWRATIIVARKQIYLGGFATPVAAAHAYNRAAKLYFGGFAVLNRVSNA
jgi:hypothetical protein